MAETQQEVARRALIKVDQLENLAAAIRAPRPLNAVIELVIGQIFDIVPADAAAVWLYDADNDLWYIGGSRNLTRRASEISFKSDDTLHAKIGDEGAVVHNLTSVGFRRLYPEHDLIRGALYAPMKIAGRRVGLIALYRNTEAEFTDDDLRFVRTVGSHAWRRDRPTSSPRSTICDSRSRSSTSSRTWRRRSSGSNSAASRRPSPSISRT
jgi:GAF domain-containing protein